MSSSQSPKSNSNLNLWNKYANIWDFPLLQIFFNFLHQTSINLLKEYLKDNIKILDIGCATGNFLFKIQKINSKIELYGVDFSPKMIGLAKNKFKNIKFYNLRAEKIDFPSNYFDIINIIETFHHLQDQNLVLEKIHKILKPEGILLICEPDINNKLINLFINFLKKSHIEKESKFFNQQQIIELASSFQLKPIKTKKFLGNIFLLFKNHKF
jgi:ubiquinone/menaquinone biosynthesis C-methylase UbiE